MDNSAGEGDTSVTSFPSPEPPNRSPAVALEPVVVHGLSSRAALRLDSLDLATACPSVCPSVCVTVILPEEDARGLCSPQNLRPDHPGHDGPELVNRERLRQDLHPGRPVVRGARRAVTNTRRLSTRGTQQLDLLVEPPHPSPAWSQKIRS